MARCDLLINPRKKIYIQTVIIGLTRGTCNISCIFFISSSSSALINITSSCNAACNCDVKYFSPVCSKQDQLTFYSPCYAGCTAENVLGDKVSPGALDSYE